MGTVNRCHLSRRCGAGSQGQAVGTAQCPEGTGTHKGEFALALDSDLIVETSTENPPGSTGAPAVPGTIWGPGSVSEPPTWVLTTASVALPGFHVLPLPLCPTPTCQPSYVQAE